MSIFSLLPPQWTARETQRYREVSLFCTCQTFVELDQPSDGAESPGRRSSVVLFGGLEVSVSLVL